MHSYQVSRLPFDVVYLPPSSRMMRRIGYNINRLSWKLRNEGNEWPLKMLLLLLLLLMELVIWQPLDVVVLGQLVCLRPNVMNLIILDESFLPPSSFSPALSPSHRQSRAFVMQHFCTAMEELRCLEMNFDSLQSLLKNYFSWLEIVNLTHAFGLLIRIGRLGYKL